MPEIGLECMYVFTKLNFFHMSLLSIFYVPLEDTAFSLAGNGAELAILAVLC